MSQSEWNSEVETLHCLHYTCEQKQLGLSKNICVIIVDKVAFIDGRTLQSKNQYQNNNANMMVIQSTKVK